MASTMIKKKISNLVVWTCTALKNVHVIFKTRIKPSWKIPHHRATVFSEFKKFLGKKKKRKPTHADYIKLFKQLVLPLFISKGFFRIEKPIDVT